MNEAFENLILAFCGLVLAFALLFAGCWCLVSCSFFCIKFIYRRTVPLNTMISVVSLTSESESASDLESQVYSQHGYLDSVDVGSADGGQTGISRTNGSRLPKAKAPLDTPPSYDCPPSYESLYPTSNSTEK